MTTLQELLARPPAQRLREYKYRCAQSIIFGIPVFALHYFGQSLGGPESARWSAILQALLAGWIMYIGAAGMLFEGLIQLRQRFTADFAVAAIAVGLYLWSLVAALFGRATLFHISVMIIAGWTALQWARYFIRAGKSATRSSASARGSAA